MPIPMTTFTEADADRETPDFPDGCVAGSAIAGVDRLMALVHWALAELIAVDPVAGREFVSAAAFCQMDRTGDAYGERLDRIGRDAMASAAAKLREIEAARRAGR